MSGAVKESAPDTLDTIRKWTRDVAIIVAIVILVINPAIVGRFLREAKLQLTYDEGSKTWTVKANEDKLNLATDLANLTTQTQALQDQVKRVAGGKTDPALSSLSQEVDSLAAKANAASESAAASLATQQTAPGAPDAAQASDGWVFLGKVTSANAEAWAGRHYIQSDTPAGLANKTVTAGGNVFLRAGGQPPGGAANKGWHSRQKVIGAIKSGERLDILDTEVDEAVDGGWAMWARVKRAG